MQDFLEFDKFQVWIRDLEYKKGNQTHATVDAWRSLDWVRLKYFQKINSVFSLNQLSSSIFLTRRNKTKLTLIRVRVRYVISFLNQICYKELRKEQRTGSEVYLCILYPRTYFVRVFPVCIAIHQGCPGQGRITIHQTAPPCPTQHCPINTARHRAPTIFCLYKLWNWRKTRREGYTNWTTLNHHFHKHFKLRNLMILTKMRTMTMIMVMVILMFMMMKKITNHKYQIPNIIMIGLFLKQTMISAYGGLVHFSYPIIFTALLLLVIYTGPELPYISVCAT